MTFTLLPAVDVSQGQAVRLDKGEAGTETSYGSPRDAAQKWQSQGAHWLHFVDLDAAFGRGSNHAEMATITRELGVNVELSGGIRDDAAVERALATGAQRISIGTAALERPEWIEDILARYGDKVAVDLAVREEGGEWRTAGNGWVSDGGDLWEVLERLDAAGCQRFVVTDVSKDGMLTGPNIELLREVAMATEAKITASGGISSVEDLRELALYENEGIDSAIIGKALYEGKFTLDEALAAVAEVEPLPAEETIDPFDPEDN